MLKRFKSAWKALISSDALQERSEVVEDVLYGKMSSMDIEAIKATADFVTAVCSNNCEAAVDAGSIVFFKVKNENGEYQIIHKRLNVRERIFLNKNPTALKSPMVLLERFESGIPLDFDHAAELRRISLEEKKD